MGVEGVGNVNGDEGGVGDAADSKRLFSSGNGVLAVVAGVRTEDGGAVDVAVLGLEHASTWSDSSPNTKPSDARNDKLSGLLQRTFSGETIPCVAP